MTGQRTSAIFKPEKEFGVEDASSGAVYHRFPTGLSFDYSPKNNIKSYNEIGSKFIDTAVAGMFSGTWTAKFKLDYECIGVLGMVFEDYEYEPVIDDVTLENTHRFSKRNGYRVPSSTIRVKKMNKTVGGSKDQTVKLYGCVADTISMNQSSQNAVIDVTISGQYQNEDSDYTDLDQTDWAGFYDNDDCVPVEWTCVNVNDSPVAYTESASFSVRNSVSMVPGCGKRFYQNYQEGQSNVSMSTSCYSVNPEVYYQRMYSGGYNNNMTSPKQKGLRPIEKVSYKSFFDSTGQESQNYDYTFTINGYDVYVDSVGTMSFNAGSKISDNPNFIVTKFDIFIKNKSGKITMWENDD